MMRRLLRWVMRGALLIGGPVVLALTGLWIYMSTGQFVTTENAYVKADLIVVTPEVSGRVVEVGVADNQPVMPGDMLFRLDRQRLEVEQARLMAEMDAARQRVDAVKARHRTKLAELDAARADAAFLEGELARSERLRRRGTISEFRLIAVKREADQARRRIDVVRQEIAEGLSELGGDPEMPAEQHPDVLRALAALERVRLDLDATVVRASARAIAANVRLQVGEYLEAGDPVMSLVGTETLWVEANLKETDLTHLAVGQAATLRIDAYPDWEWQAEVGSLSPATGAEYALLPPQNASGNWVKVVQRVPVRLDIAPLDGAPPLRSGMSVSVSIDTGHQRPLPEVLNTARAWILPDPAE